MPRHGQRTEEETSVASREAFKGAVVGAAKVKAAFPSFSLKCLLTWSHDDSGVSLPVVSVSLATFYRQYIEI